ncbi:MAG: hypothetical protein NTU97_02105 [Candidatus Magasanikbacteria bacterium]|nr:hypothetical protein [Candidatus Magasanikbacteria bacterium]
MKNRLPYAVVYEYTEAAGGYNGVRTWTAFRDMNDFEKWLKQPDNHVLDNQKVIAQGVTEQQAIDIISGTPVEAYAAASIDAATSGGLLSWVALEVELTNVAVARRLTGQDDSGKLFAAAHKELRRQGRI